MGGHLEGIREPAGGPVQGYQLEWNLLRHRHHHLLQLGLRSQAHQPDLAAGHILRQVGRLVQGVRRPRVKDCRQHHLVLERRTRRAGDRLQGLKRIGNDGTADNDLKTSGHASLLEGVRGYERTGIGQRHPPVPSCFRTVVRFNFLRNVILRFRPGTRCWSVRDRPGAPRSSSRGTPRSGRTSPGQSRARPSRPA